MIESHNLLAQLNRRYATKQFDPTKKIPQEQFDVLLESLRLAPSSFGLQWRWFVVVESQNLREQLVHHSRDQLQVTDASHLLVLCRTLDMTKESVEEFISKTASVRSVPLETLNWYKQMILWFLKSKTDDEISDRLEDQVYIALGFLLTTCAHMGIDACPMEWFDANMYDEILWLHTNGLTSCVVVPVGYRHPDDKYADLPKVRYDASKVIVYK